MPKQFTSVWTREPRQPKESGLGRDQIVTAAVELLDAEGLDALSMRKLGAKLGAGATSLYWYVATKDELLELVLNEFWALVETPEPDEAPWREMLNNFAYSFRATLRAHPWAATLVAQVPSMGPNALRLNDRLRRTFTGAGFRGQDIYLAAGTVMCFVLGQVTPEIAWAKAYGDDNLDPAAMMRMMDQLASDYPEMREDYRRSIPTDPEFGRAMAFDFGLLCVLDGLESRLRSAAEVAHDYPPTG